MELRFPRETVHWHPKIDAGSCAGDRVCIDFCPNGVFCWDPERQKPIVASPLLCALGCDACAKLCPTAAIVFPTKETLRLELHGAFLRVRAAGAG